MMHVLKPANTLVQFVSDLINTENWAWKTELVRELFIVPDVEVILNIPLCAKEGVMIF